MAKFVVIARQAFVDLVRGLKSSGVKKGTSDLPDMIEKFKDQRGRIQAAYRKATGADIPEGKIAVPKVLYTRLQDKTAIKKMDQGAIQDAMEQATDRSGKIKMPPLREDKKKQTFAKRMERVGPENPSRWKREENLEEARQEQRYMTSRGLRAKAPKKGRQQVVDDVGRVIFTKPAPSKWKDR
jgi:hypothetical protein